jgi:hypothetical protein
MPWRAVCFSANAVVGNGPEHFLTPWQLIAEKPPLKFSFRKRPFVAACSRPFVATRERQKRTLEAR